MCLVDYGVEFLSYIRFGGSDMNTPIKLDSAGTCVCTVAASVAPVSITKQIKIISLSVSHSLRHLGNELIGIIRKICRVLHNFKVITTGEGWEWRGGQGLVPKCNRRDIILQR